MEILTITKHVWWQECNSQIERINYEKTFASVAKHTSIQMVFGINVMIDFEIHQMDVKITFSMEN
jgi:hypothetical protein